MERREDKYYQLCMVIDLKEGKDEPLEEERWLVFRNTYDIKTVCDDVVRLFKDGDIRVHYVPVWNEGEEKSETEKEPILIPAKS